MIESTAPPAGAWPVIAATIGIGEQAIAAHRPKKSFQNTRNVVALQLQQRRHVEAGREHAFASAEHDAARAFARRGFDRVAQRAHERGIERVDRRAREAEFVDRVVLDDVEHG